MEASIIIPTKDRGAIFDETLLSVIEATKDLEVEVIVINDSKVSAPVIPESLKNVKLLHNPKSGVASARNLGASVARSELLVFMDDDFIVSGESIKRVLSMASKYPTKIYLFNWIYPPVLRLILLKSQFGRYLVAHGFTTLQGWLGEEWRDEEVFELKGGASYFLPIPKDLFNKIGGYHEDFPHAGAEDYFFINEARKIGISFYLDKSHTLFHNEKDRMEIKNWLARKARNGETLKTAVQLGRSEMAIEYSPFKIVVFSIFSRLKWLFFLIQKMLPNFRRLDPIYFKLTNALLATYIFEGYTKNDKFRFRDLIKSLYKFIPFKKPFFLLLRKFSLPQSIYQHLYFKGIFTIKAGNNSFKMMHYGYELENEVFWKGLEGWEKTTLQVWTILSKKASCILDIGANTGVFCLASAAINRHATIIAFEPVSRIFSKLSANIKLNKFKIVPVEMGISNFVGKAIIYDMLYEHVYSVTINKNMNLNSSNRPTIPTEIQVTTISDYADGHHLSRIDLIKIDVETHEPEVLEGMREILERDMPTIIIEILNEEIAEKVNKLLSGLDYSFFVMNDSVGPQKVAKIEMSEFKNYLVCGNEDVDYLKKNMTLR